MFVARGAVDRLAEAADSGQVAVLCAVTGLRGVGKSQVAAAYARSRIKAGWGLVGWVNAESADTLLAGLARVAAAVRVSDPDGDSAESGRRLRDHLDTWPGPGLLVFDNAADQDVLRQFLPAAGGTQIVVTSTDRAFTGWGITVDVSAFTRAESKGYLARRTKLHDDAGADAVADKLGDLPLALAQAASTIEGRHWTFRRYLNELEGVPVEALLNRDPGGDYPRPTAAALLLSVQAAEEADPSGLTGLLLRVVAALSPDGVPWGLLERIGVSGGDDVAAALERCARGSLLTWSVGGDAVLMHGLLGRVLRERDQVAGRWRATVVAAIDVLEPVLFDEDQAWSRRAEGSELGIQVEALWEADAAAGTADLDLAERLLGARSWAVAQLTAAADLSRSIDAGMRVLADCTRVFGEDHPASLRSRDNLAVAYQTAGRLAEATPLLERNLADVARVFGEDHPETLMSRNNLAVAYREAGRLDEAIVLFERNLSDCMRVFGEDHPDTLSSRSNLARAYEWAGRLSEAILLDEQNLADRARVLGADHPATLRSRNNLAGAYESAARLDKAIPLDEQNLAHYVRVLGEDHPDTLNSRNNIANGYREAGRLSEAIPLHEKSVADYVRVLGADHPATLMSQNNLAGVYQEAGRLDEAIVLFERNLADRVRVLGEDHPDTLISRNNLAGAHREAGQLDQAIPLYEQNVANRRRVLNEDHPDSLISRNNLAGAYQEAGRLGDAILLYERNFAASLQVLGEDHPDTLMSRNNLAGAYRDAGRLDESIALFERNLADCMRVFGADHPTTLRSRNNLAGAHQAALQLGEALPPG